MTALDVWATDAPDIDALVAANRARWDDATHAEPSWSEPLDGDAVPLDPEPLSPVEADRRAGWHFPNH